MTTASLKRTSEAVTVDGKTAEAFRRRLSGSLVLPSDSGYDAARRVWNGMIDKRPALIAYCASVRDVVESVDFARVTGLLTAVRGGGHNIAGASVCDGGLVIDLSHIESRDGGPKSPRRARGGRRASCRS